MSALEEMKKRIREIDLREMALSKVNKLQESIQNAVTNFDNFIEGNFDNSVEVLGRKFDEQVMIDYFKNIDMDKTKNEKYWLSIMAVDEVFSETIKTCPRLLLEVYNEQSPEYKKEGLKVSYANLLKLPSNIPAMNFMNSSDIQVKFSEENNVRKLDMNHIKRLLMQSPKNIDYLLKNNSKFDNLNEVFETFPQMIRQMDQKVLVNPEYSEVIKSVIKTAAKNSPKVQSYIDVYLSYAFDKNGNVLSVESKSEKNLNEVDPFRLKKNEVTNRIAAMTSNPDSPQTQRKLGNK